ncbi:signal peptidase I [Clostridiaceae bacterium HSG29]|nr:signal peptidase I [Clostridiaceae bacterium HSG29]
MIFALVIVGVLNVFITTTMVYSTSMYPTLIEKDLLILKKSKDIERGDIVSFVSELTINQNDIDTLNIIQKLKSKVGDNKSLIKRVIGLPGDSLLISDGKVYINGELYDEDYLNSITSGNVKIDKIPENKYFLMGDNRRVSLDSRSELVGLVDKEAIIGDVLVRIFPLNRIGVVE